MVAALTLLRVGLRMPRCASTTAPMALSCGVTTACMCARRPSLDQSRNVCRAAAYSGGCRAVVARPRDNLALSLAARQPCPLGEVVARYRATTSPLRRGGPHPLFFDRATTSPLRRGCRAVPRDNPEYHTFRARGRVVWAPGVPAGLGRADWTTATHSLRKHSVSPRQERAFRARGRVVWAAGVPAGLGRDNVCINAAHLQPAKKSGRCSISAQQPHCGAMQHTAP